MTAATRVARRSLRLLRRSRHNRILSRCGGRLVLTRIVIWSRAVASGSVVGCVEECDPVGDDVEPVLTLPVAVVVAVRAESAGDGDVTALTEVFRGHACDMTPRFDVDPQALWAVVDGDAEGGDDTVGRVTSDGVVGEAAGEVDVVHSCSFRVRRCGEGRCGRGRFRRRG